MLEVLCSGTPQEIGYQHGFTAKLQITRSITFYKSLFQSKCKMDWEKVKEFALKYDPYLQELWPHYVAEMHGVANGAGVTYPDILALNVRTEVAFGNFNDGCTAFSWKGAKSSILAQNWDWNTDQAENLISLKIKKKNGLNIQMITESGIIGKIGLNSEGVGCTLNALKARGFSYNKLPCHLALRTVMESSSREAAVSMIEKAGVASACHILVADITGVWMINSYCPLGYYAVLLCPVNPSQEGISSTISSQDTLKCKIADLFQGTGLECSSEDLVKLEMNREGIVAHTNHFLLKHKDNVVESLDWLSDTRYRQNRVHQLLSGAKEEEPSTEVAAMLLKDEVEGDGAAICRSAKPGKDHLATLFSIVIDLANKEAKVTVGRPASSTEVLILKP